MNVVITAKRGLFLWLLAITLSMTVPLTCMVCRTHPSPPDPPKMCHDSVHLLKEYNAWVDCSPGAHVESGPAVVSSGGEPKFVIKCVCGLPAPRDAGGAP